MKLENWYVSEDDNPYCPPELRQKYVSGAVYGNPRFSDGYRVTTSNIVSINGNKITTNSGSVYELGTPSEDYINWLKANNMTLPTPECPIKIV